MNAKTQLQSRRLGVARTSVSDLTRLRMNAFAQHAILSNLIKTPNGRQNENAVPPLNWQRHDPSERIYYTGVERLVEKYKKDVLGMVCFTEGNLKQSINLVLEGMWH